MEKDSTLMSTNVGIVVVSYNSGAELNNCIQSAIRALKKAKVTGEIIVVDNNSADNSIAIAKKAGVTTLANGKNLGFAKAVNIGVKRAFKDSSSTHVLLLNPDAIMGPLSLSFLLRGLQSNPKVGATGPSMLDEAGKPATAGYYLKAPSWMSILLFSTFLRPYFINKQWWVRTFYEETGLVGDREVQQIPGACLLVPRAVLEDVGLLDEDFAIWYEDVEWSYRARKKGYTLWFCKDAAVQHIGGVSFAKWQNIDKAVTFYVSMKTFFKKHKPVSYFIILLIMIINSIVMFLKNRDKSNLVFLKKFLREKKGKLPN